MFPQFLYLSFSTLSSSIPPLLQLSFTLCWKMDGWNIVVNESMNDCVHACAGTLCMCGCLFGCVSECQGYMWQRSEWLCLSFSPLWLVTLPNLFYLTGRVCACVRRYACARRDLSFSKRRTGFLWTEHYLNGNTVKCYKKPQSTVKPRCVQRGIVARFRLTPSIFWDDLACCGRHTSSSTRAHTGSEVFFIDMRTKWYAKMQTHCFKGINTYTHTDL